MQTTLNLTAPTQAQSVVVRVTASDGVNSVSKTVSIAHSPATGGGYDYAYPAGIGSYVPGQTVVLGGLLVDDTTKVKDKVPFLGDLPYLGRLFRSESNNTKKRNLVIFVTPTIIDPTGTRVHSDAEMPFAQNQIPAQRPLTQ